MADEIASQARSQFGAATDTDGAIDNLQRPLVKRSWRRKYRKMRAKFEDTMALSNKLIMDEWKAQALARRLQEQNDQILEILLSMNETVRLPSHMQFDLGDPSDSKLGDTASAIDEDPAYIQGKLEELRAELASGTVTAEDYSRRTGLLHHPSPTRKTRSLAMLESTVPHTSELPDPPIDGIDLSDNATGHMSPTHEEEYLMAIDVALADPSYDPDVNDGRPLRITPIHTAPSEKDLTVRNPNSVYNWLRKNQPQVFLQDKDAPQPENGSEKSSARTANANARGKRQSTLAGTPGPKTEADDEDANYVPEPGAIKSRKSKGGDDDAAYRPKGGSSRPSKRKRDDGEATPKPRAKKSKANLTAVA